MAQRAGDWVRQPETYGGLVSVGPNRYIDLPLTAQPSQLTVAPPLGLGSTAMVRLPSTSNKMLAVRTRGYVVWNVVDAEINNPTSTTHHHSIQKLMGDPEDPTLIPARTNFNPFFWATADSMHMVWMRMTYRRVPPVGFWDDARPNGRQMAWGIMYIDARYRQWVEPNEQMVYTIASQETILNPDVNTNFRLYLSTYVIPMS